MTHTLLVYATDVADDSMRYLCFVEDQTAVFSQLGAAFFATGACVIPRQLVWFIRAGRARAAACSMILSQLVWIIGAGQGLLLNA